MNCNFNFCVQLPQETSCRLELKQNCHTLRQYLLRQQVAQQTRSRICQTCMLLVCLYVCCTLCCLINVYECILKWSILVKRKHFTLYLYINLIFLIKMSFNLFSNYWDPSCATFTSATWTWSAKSLVSPALLTVCLVLSFGCVVIGTVVLLYWVLSGYL